MLAAQRARWAVRKHASVCVPRGTATGLQPSSAHLAGGDDAARLGIVHHGLGDAVLDKRNSDTE